MNYKKVIASNANELKPSGIRKFFDIVSTMKDAISLGVGEPDFITPWQVRQDAIESIQKGRTQYTSNAGLLELRAAVAKYMHERYNLKYNFEDEVVITVGASEGIDLSLRAIIEKGDEVIIPEPSYVSYAPCVNLQGGVSVACPCSHQNDFKVIGEELAKVITSKTKAVILPFPNNPTGAILEREYLEDIAKVLSAYPDIVIISDEIYSELTYGGKKHCSIAEIEGMWERTIVINGFSKSFAMTGWRIGYVCAPKPLLDVILKIHQYVIMCAPTAGQYAALSALTISFQDNFEMVQHMKEEYDMRRRFMVSAFNDMGLKCFEPLGAFYVFPSVESLNLTGEEFAERLLISKKVAVVPGASFGNSGRNFIRCSYAYSMKNLEIAVGRIEEFVKEIRGDK